MLVAEQSGAFQYKSSVTTIPDVEAKPAEAMIDELRELSISRDSATSIASMGKSMIYQIIPEKSAKLASSSRPLTIDDDDLDIDLEIDDTIDTTVSG